MMMHHGKNIERRGVGRWAAAVLVSAAFLAGCSPRDIVGDVALPPEFHDPAATETPAGAMQAYNGVLAQFRKAFGARDSGFVVVTGMLGDELESPEVGDPNFYAADPIDSRTLPEDASDPDYDASALYGLLQGVRGQGAQAIGLLRDFAPDSSPALRGRLYALQGYSEVMLAELYCSGIPLSTLDYNGDYTLAPGSSTSDVFEHAVALFDTALALSGDSARLLNLARVGKGRALLALGRFADAAAAVQEVPTGFRYEVSYTASSNLNDLNANFLSKTHTVEFTVSDAEGVNGLPYRSSGDPRVGAVPADVDIYGHPVSYPAKYAADGTSPIVLADWIEARLIQAETALQQHDAGTWLARLNELRETAITPALPDTTDPGRWDAEVDLQFHERAFWLFLTGHRQGDLRRLIREYGRAPERVYPSGLYNGHRTYGTDVDVPIPVAEQDGNPLFKGCLARGA
ncbi:MAG TPA: hypothetical protein VF041_18890 [Gemmatimonadaceae bacterium]